jgi:predicted nucleotidyltransferase
VSVLIRDQILDDEDLNWLISNYQKSEHIVNRLLRYPDKNKLVKLWAAKVYLKRELISRNSELIGILIEEDIPGFVDTSDTSEVIWGIYYAKCSEKIKYQLIIKYMDMVSVKEVVKVAIRLSCSEIIEKLLDKSKSLGII